MANKKETLAATVRSSPSMSPAVMVIPDLDAETEPIGFMVVFIVSAISAWCAIKVFLNLLDRTGMFPYVVYRLLLGAVLLYMFV